MRADPLALAAIAAIFVAAGWVKGVVGMGLPTVAMGALGLLMAPAQAAALLVAPSFVTNVWQLAVGPSLGPLARRLATMMIGVCLGTGLGIGFMTSGGTRWPSFALGCVLALYGVLGLTKASLSVAPRHEAVLSPAIGLVTGAVTGATGVFVVPAVPYLAALGLPREALIQALGLSFTVSTVALGVALGTAGGFTTATALASAAAIVPALAGLWAGQRLRHRLDPERFRRWFFAAMLAIGAIMACRALFA